MSCEKCGGKCCKYIVLHASWFDYDIHWMMGRNGKMIGDEAIFECPCKHLTADGKCDIYENRPKFCRTQPQEMTPTLRSFGCEYFKKGNTIIENTPDAIKINVSESIAGREKLQ